MKRGKKDKTDGIKRRDFLKILSAGFAAASGCKLRPPKERIVPFVDLPEGVVPGLARWYATTCAACPASCGILVKSRDGRPIKIEGNPEHALSRGGICARGQAQVLDLYDSERYKTPMLDGRTAFWREIDARVAGELDGAVRAKKGIRLLTPTVSGPASRAAIEVFTRAFPGAKQVVFDSPSQAAIRAAYKMTHGADILPHYRFLKAKAIVSFGADFLGTWISPVEFTAGWADNRRPDTAARQMSWHAQFESRASLTGLNADLRVPIAPHEEFSVAAALADRVAAALDWKGPRPGRRNPSGVDASVIEEAAARLVAVRGRSLVVSDSEHAGTQVLVNWLNEILGNHGSTIDLVSRSRQYEDSGGLGVLIDEMRAGKIGALLSWSANPAYGHPLARDFASAADKVPFIASLSHRPDETSALAGVVAPDHHSLESWGDAEPVDGVAGLFQPLVAPLFETRSWVESLLAWSNQGSPAYDFVKSSWKKAVFPKQRKLKEFEAFWNEAVRAGGVRLDAAPVRAPRFRPAAAAEARDSGKVPDAGKFTFIAYAGIALGDGRQADNPWLQELPDPVSKTAWGNHASFSPGDAKRLGLKEGRVVRISGPSGLVELPAHIQPGQADGVIASAIGYGRPGAGRVAANYPMEKMLPVEKEFLSGADVGPLAGAEVAVSATARVLAPAKSQTYDYLQDPVFGRPRPHALETTLSEFIKDPHSGREALPEPGPSLWPEHEYAGHKWAMAVDLSACTGCAACVVACQAENNVPVVGRAEMRKRREMHWIRVDRYYSGGPDSGEPAPDAIFQPMMCQQCDNAPCETVCPVLATVHSKEGLNMQVYNRCVGTRYCANNCPYKVRRFNWFDYAHEDLLQNMALNPDITVRTRGIMEKCNFCVQRISEAKAAAKQEGRLPKDGEISPACAQSCPASAIVFGDINDPKSRVAAAVRNPRSYTVLGELGVGPSVFYLSRVRNRRPPQRGARVPCAPAGVFGGSSCRRLSREA